MAPDPYVQPNGTLRNRLGIADADELSQREADLSRARLFLIETEGPQGPFDFERLKATHRYIFHDVYDWAGEPRTTNLYKREYDGGPLAAFTTPDEIAPRAARIFTALEHHNQLQGLDRETFSRQAADLFAGINALHPFREGNGRTQRAFIEALAGEAGHELDFSVISKERMIEASVQASKRQPDMMRRMFAEISDPERVRPLGEALRFLAGIKEVGGKPFDWNELYVATTTPGQRYDGRLVGWQGENFLMRQDGHLFVGWTADLPESAQRGAPVSFVASGLRGQAPAHGAAKTEPPSESDVDPVRPHRNRPR
ncbi:Fic family protein [Mycobacterium sp. KBS0706]|uniref:Fic/DOC family protein n=1 Tax=Mycobacterium sp. KBS0706 TaxID=2578109 RepID=UPI00163D4163|nr:Fic family protein [Mycobacterium sp. KBS0706]